MKVSKKIFLSILVIIIIPILFLTHLFKNQTERTVGEARYSSIPTVGETEESIAQEQELLTYKSKRGFSFKYPPHLFVETQFEPYELYIWPKSIIEKDMDPNGGIKIEMYDNDKKLSTLEWVRQETKADLSKGYDIWDLDGQEAIVLEGGTWVTVKSPNNKDIVLISFVPGDDLLFTEIGTVISTLSFKP